MNIKILEGYMIWCRVWGEVPSFVGLRVFNEIESDIDTEHRMIDDIAEDIYMEQ